MNNFPVVPTSKGYIVQISGHTYLNDNNVRCKKLENAHVFKTRAKAITGFKNWIKG